MKTTALVRIPYVNIAAQQAAIKEEILEALERVLDKGQFILGEEVSEFERRFAELCGVRYAVAVNSGTDALILALRALGIGPGDEVITVPNSFIATTSAIALVGATPRFIDVRDDLNMDPARLEAALTARTKAILPVHLTGRPADMDSILNFAKRKKLWVVEDAAQAVMAEYRGKRVGSFGHLGCFSLHPLKTLNAAGDGGALTTDDPALSERLRILRNLGLESRENCVTWSGNSRLDTLQAALLLVKLKYLPQWTQKRQANARSYQKFLQGIPEIQIPFDPVFEKAVYHTFVIQADYRNQLKEFLAERGVETAIHYPIPIHLQKAAESLGYGPNHFPVCERQAARVLSLPIYPELTEGDLAYVAEQIRQFYKSPNSCK